MYSHDTYRKSTFLLIAVIVLLCLSSCRVYKISKKEKEWIPYEADQKIVFRSQGGKTDTIYIIKKELFRHTAPMQVFSDVNQSITVTARVPDPFTNVGNLNFTHSYQPLVGIHTEDSETFITINLEVYGNKFSGKNNSATALGKGAAMKLGGRTYDDIIIFECNDERTCRGEKVIKQVYWSSKHGLVQYAFDGEEWNFSETIQ